MESSQIHMVSDEGGRRVADCTGGCGGAGVCGGNGGDHLVWLVIIVHGSNFGHNQPYVGQSQHNKKKSKGEIHFTSYLLNDLISAFEKSETMQNGRWYVGIILV